MPKRRKKTAEEPGYPESCPPTTALPPPPVQLSYAPPAPVVTSTYRTSLANVMGSSEATVAKVTYEVFDPRDGFPRTFAGTGSSRRERGDAHDPVIGELLAVARAYEQLAARVHREARKRMNRADSERRQRENKARKNEAKPVKVSELRNAKEIHERNMRDPVYAHELELLEWWQASNNPHGYPRKGPV